MAQSVLLVEDEDSIATALEFLMQREGYLIRRVTTGPAALDAIAEEVPDLVLLDISLPGASGYEVCQKIRLDPALSSVKILMMTATGGAIPRRKSLDMGADGFITKPFSVAALIDEVRRVTGDEETARDV
ncbi:response regulator transcription factor [Algihabitans albus]|uniref:response regulator transcription factor n=1 Tax=Algihabitans albus TaxID=2164067 RepID=UPI001F455002|nr:response regulator [Algihabitans albus]